ncbi:hypothetical protein SUDANB6_00292 [Streptomyces sp. enrichment culture]
MRRPAATGGRRRRAAGRRYGALVAAAFGLFPARGCERTAVDDIVALAGVGRRSFFRCFPPEGDVVLPDHEHCPAGMTAFLAASATDDEPVRRVCDAARLVLRVYAGNPVFSVQRYRLARQVPGLRAYGLSVVRRRERTPAAYPRGRLAGHRDGTLRADVIAAAHHNALRSWLRSGSRGDVGAAVDRAPGYVQSAFGTAAAPPGRGGVRRRGGHRLPARRAPVEGDAGDRDRARAALDRTIRIRSAFTRDTECHTLSGVHGGTVAVHARAR